MDLNKLLDDQPDAKWRVIEDKGQVWIVDVNNVKIRTALFGDFQHNKDRDDS